MQVLIVEDEVRLAEALAHIMKEEKYLVDTVHTGTDGLEYARSGLYDVVILDVMLPGLSGFEIIKRLRTEKIDTPVIMLTVRARRAARTGARHLPQAGRSGPGRAPFFRPHARACDQHAHLRREIGAPEL